MVSLAVAVSISGCAPSVEQEIVKPINGETKLSYETAVAEYRTIENEERIPANIGFSTSTSFEAPFKETKIKNVYTSQNSTVKKGDVLMELDTTDLDFQITEQEILVAQASDSISKEAAQIELDELLELKQQSIIEAPYDGIVSKMIFASEGTTVPQGTEICCVSVPETLFIYNEGGAGKNLRFGMEVKLVVNNEEYAGTVTAAPDTAPSDASNAALNYSAAKLYDDDLKRLLTEGTGAAQAAEGWATIYAVTVRRTNVLAVPEKAIKKESNSYYCSILRGEEKYDMPVEVGVTAGGYTEILSGINEGDTVILSDGAAAGNNNNNNNNNNNDRNDRNNQNNRGEQGENDEQGGNNDRNDQRE